ncbi:MAG: putative ABC transporter permease [Lachnospiraceae bacterium]|nr:putative ABC transporter permease [Lachnospiraceae bacterium]
MLIFVIAGIYGWCYEFVFYYFNGGMKEFYMQGGNFLPWINIYAFGALLFLLFAGPFKKYPWAVILIVAVVSGTFEYLSGWAIYKIGNGLRYWDYSKEILNFGNINGFVCLRSVLVFVFSGLLLIYAVFPLLDLISKKANSKIFVTVSCLLLVIFLADEVYNFLASHVFGWVNAITVYESMGLKYMNY